MILPGKRMCVWNNADIQRYDDGNWWNNFQLKYADNTCYDDQQATEALNFLKTQLPKLQS